MVYRYYISKKTDPYINLAVERCLFECSDENIAVLYLWQNDNTIVIGKNQDVYSECRVGEFIASGGRIARRMSGGGAVYHDLGNLNFSIICKAPVTDKTAYQNLVMYVLKHLGINAEFSGRNDIVYLEKKFSGNAVYNSGENVCQHGTVLVNTDIEKMSYYLTPEREKLMRHSVDSVRSRVINLRDVVPTLTVETVINSFLAVSRAKPLDKEPCEKLIRKYTELFGSDEWIYGGEYENTVAFGVCP